MLIYALVGPIGAGKTTFGSNLMTWVDGNYFSTSKWLKTLNPTIQTRRGLQIEGDRIDRESDGMWILSECRRMKPTFRRPVIVDCVRSSQQIRHLRNQYGLDMLVVGIRSSVIDEHIRDRNYDLPQMRELLEALQHPLEQKLPMNDCDMIFDNTRFPSQSLIQLAHFSANSKERPAKVDVR